MRFQYCRANTCLILVAWSLAVFNQWHQRLIHQKRIRFVDIEAKETEATGRTATDTVKKLQRFTDDVVVSLVSLCTQEVLQRAVYSSVNKWQHTIITAIVHRGSE